MVYCDVIGVIVTSLIALSPYFDMLVDHAGTGDDCDVIFLFYFILFCDTVTSLIKLSLYVDMSAPHAWTRPCLRCYCDIIAVTVTSLINLSLYLGMSPHSAGTCDSGGLTLTSLGYCNSRGTWTCRRIM